MSSRENSSSPLPPLSRLDRALVAYTRFAARHPWRVLAVAFCVLAVSWGTAASILRVRADFVRLLPSESETAKRFKKSIVRKRGGRSNLLILVESPDPEANKRVVLDLEARLKKLPKTMLSSVARGPGEELTFYANNRWLFATLRDLRLAECEVRREREKRLPGWLDISDPCEEEVDFELEEEAEKRGRDLALEEPDLGLPVEKKPAPEAKASGKQPPPEPEQTALGKLKSKLEGQMVGADRFKDGFFKSSDGRTFMMRLESPAAGMGEFGADDLFAETKRIVGEANPAQHHAEMVVGFGGDIPNAIGERNALIENVSIVSGTALLLILGVIIIFFRSGKALIHIGLAVGTGCGVAFATAALAFGFLNVATSFLGSIIAGNGINDAIVYLGRYKQRRAAGDSHEDALVDTAVTCRAGTWLASVGASGAYAALMITSFRGFSEFGLIGGVGMISCWFATFGFVPASLTILERRRVRKAAANPSAAADTTEAPEPLTPEGMRTPISSFIARIGKKYRWVVLTVAAALGVAAAYPLPEYLKNPWEYNFRKLRSKSSSKGGAGKWSSRANEITKSRGSPDLVLAEELSQVQGLKKEILARDQAVTGGKFVERVVTVYDRLGGAPELVDEKLKTLASIRTEIDKSMSRLSAEDKETAVKWRPPERLRRLEPKDLPGLLRDQFSEKDDTVGTPVYVYWNRNISRSRGENLLVISEILETVKLPDGSVAANASRATVFAEMIRSMERDGPRATLGAFLVVVLVALMVTRALRSASVVIGSLVLGVLLTVGGAAWLGVRLNFLNFVALPLTFGIGVEYAINLYDRIRFAGGDVSAGIASAGGAVTVCSLTTIFGYGSLLFADNQALQSFGKYAVAGEIATLLTALFVMPAALHVWSRRTT